MRLRDQFGNPVSTQNRRALELYDRALAELNVYRVDPLATIDAALAEDPGFVMGHCFKAGLLTTTSEGGAQALIGSALRAIEAAGAKPLERERMHIAAARAWLERDFARSNRLYGEIVLAWPRDLLALQVAHLQDFLLGQSSLLRDRPAGALPEWSEQDSAYGILLGMHAFGLEESGQYALAEGEGRRAVELERADSWAAHAVAHVMEMQGRTAQGVEWLQGTSAGWSEQCFFAYHNWWHLALLRLETGDHAGALELLDTRIRPAPSVVAMEMVDASALLWRLYLRGVDVGSRWNELADSWESFAETGYYAFNDVHALMAFLCAGREQSVARVLGALQEAAGRADTNGTMSRDVGLPVARGLVAFARGDYARALEELGAVRGIAQRFGGSHAQRDLVHLTLLEAALRAGRRSAARVLAAERLALKPESPLNRQLASRAAALRAAGEEGLAA